MHGIWLFSHGRLRSEACLHVVPHHRCALAAQASERNLRQALLILETCHVAQNPLQAQQPLQLPDWELYIQARRPPLPAQTPGSSPGAANWQKECMLGCATAMQPCMLHTCLTAQRF